MRDVRLHDTRTGSLVPLRPREGRRVGIYACGPTVYARVHVGNARPYVVFMLLKRFLAHEGYDAVFVANITDINDKIYDAARAQRVHSDELAREMAALYVADTDLLGLGRPDHEPLASEYIDPITDVIGALIDSGHAYAVEGDVYFRVRSFPAYGSLSHRPLAEMSQGESVERKEDPLDFALWKATKEGEDTSWPAPWGEGRPGWHIECSAMAEALLGADFEIHGGGSDLVFPHHENEIAQTEAARGVPLARIWMHNGMLELGEKMAKSVGNVRSIADAVAYAGRDALIMLFVSANYRKPMAYGEEELDEAERACRRIREAARRLVPGDSPASLAAYRDAFFAHLADDFNTPAALAEAFAWVREANKADAPVGDAQLREMLGVLGLDNLLDVSDDGPPAEALELLERRQAARAARDYAAADALREQLRALGWEVRDSATGAELVRA